MSLFISDSLQGYATEKTGFALFLFLEEGLN